MTVDEPDQLVLISLSSIIFASPPQTNSVSIITTFTPHIMGQVKNAQRQDAELQHIIQLMHAGSITRRWKVINNYLYHDTPNGPKLLVPNDVIPEVCKYHRDDDLAGHPGVAETERTISKSLYWPTQRKDVQTHVNSCIICQRHKTGPANLKAGLPLRHPSTPFQTINVDLMGPYPRTPRGFTNLLTVEDSFAR